jgi:glycine hydroxymethyltransferase
VTGKEVSTLLDQVQITVNKNLIPFDPQSPVVTSGIRVGTPTVTSRGMGEEEMKTIAQLIDRAVTHKDDEKDLDNVREVVYQLTEAFPIYGGLRE